MKMYNIRKEGLTTGIFAYNPTHLWINILTIIIGKEN